MKITFLTFFLFTALSVSARRQVAESENGASFDVQEWIAQNRAPGTTDMTRMLRFGDHQAPVAFTEEEVEKLIFDRLPRFTDVTDFDLEGDDFQSQLLGLGKRQRITSFPDKVKPLKFVKDLCSRVNIDTHRSFIQGLQAIFTRYYTAPGGLESPTYIINRLQEIIGRRSDVSVRRFTNTFAQDSVIARIEGSSGDQTVTIAGAHLDSTGGTATPINARSPGADDDGSGAANIIEAFRILVQSGYVPRTPIEIHFYAAEEVGLRGSTAVVADYVNRRVPVKAMLNYDMTAYNRPGLNFTMGFVTDRTSASLNRFTKSIAANYASRQGPGAFPLNITDDYCGYACTDHAPWNSARIPATYPFEAITETSNPSYHNAFDTDTATGFSYEHLIQFTQTLIGFFVHLTQ